MDIWQEIEAENRRADNTRSLDLQRIRKDFQALFFGSDLGRRVFGDLLEISGFFQSSFTGNSAGFFKEGMKWFVMQIIKWAGMDSPDGLREICRILAQNQEPPPAPGNTPENPEIEI